MEEVSVEQSTPEVVELNEDQRTILAGEDDSNKRTKARRARATRRHYSARL